MGAMFWCGMAIFLASSILLSGCLGQDFSAIGKSREQQALELASATREVSIMQRLNSAFADIKDCSPAELVKEVKRLNPSAAEPSPEQKQNAQTAILKAQSCLPLLKLSLNETRTHVYLANYSFGFPKDCNAIPEIQKIGSGALEVEADIDLGTSRVVGGGISENPSAAEAVNLLSNNYGPCSLALLFPGARWDLAAQIPASQNQKPAQGLNQGQNQESPGGIVVTGSS